MLFSARRSRIASHSSRLVLLTVWAESPSRCAAAIWLRMSASSGLTMSVGPAPASRSRAVATKYTADLPHPVRWTQSTRARSATTSRIASSWPGRKSAPGSAVSARRRSSAAAVSVSVSTGATSRYWQARQPDRIGRMRGRARPSRYPSARTVSTPCDTTDG